MISAVESAQVLAPAAKILGVSNIFPSIMGVSIGSLDAYYLALERCFRTSYNECIDKVHSGKVMASDLYTVVSKASLAKEALKAPGSFSIWPFYLTLGVMIWIGMRVVIPG